MSVLDQPTDDGCAVPAELSLEDAVRDAIAALLDTPTTPGYRRLHDSCAAYMAYHRVHPTGDTPSRGDHHAPAVERAYVDLLDQVPGTAGHRTALVALRHALLQPVDEPAPQGPND